MTTLTLPRNTITKDGKYFVQITEAANRGCKLVWNEDYSNAKLKLDTLNFFSVEDAKDIIESGGEVEGYKAVLKMSKEHYETGLVPDFLQSEESQYTYKDYFPFVEAIENEEEREDVKVIMSHDNEFIPFSTVVAITKADKDVEIV